MVETKVRLSMEVPGATMLSSQDCEKMSKKEAYKQESLTIEYAAKKGKKSVTKRETIHYSVRKSKPARQNILISKEAYVYMTKGESPSPKMNKVWVNMTSAQRLEYYFNLIAEDLNAISFSYEILDD